MSSTTQVRWRWLQGVGGILRETEATPAFVAVLLAGDLVGGQPGRAEELHISLPSPLRFLVFEKNILEICVVSFLVHVIVHKVL